MSCCSKTMANCFPLNEENKHSVSYVVNLLNTLYMCGLWRADIAKK